ncbi:hypothetical protein [Pontimicrobium sp. SW4]|uniref:Toxin-antitoxin system YwqK family antitoxin n=1 Tax=Pontimicrobium sp. SW4 TaxID=3153519 RepID=A0AAU7BRZ4_9FLAO
MKTLLLIFTALLIVSCNQTDKIISEEDIEEVYNNGAKYCIGKKVVYESGYKEKVGKWMYYYPNGTILQEIDYNEVGDIVSLKEYDEDGKLSSMATDSDESRIHIEYYENGNIKYEDVMNKYTEKETVEVDENNSAEVEVESNQGVIKEYYKNGQIRTERRYEDDYQTGVEKFWNQQGQLVLEIEH